MNKILLVAINAKYIQSSLAVRSLYAYLSEEEKKYVDVLEFTINQSEDLILSEIVERKPKILALSCYIWNIDLIREIVSTFSRIKPNVPIILGGPEVSFYEFGYEFDGYNNDYLIVKGEGERIFKTIVQNFMGGKEVLKSRIITSFDTNNQLKLEEIPFPYDNNPNDFKDLENRLIYYESSRGCISKCAFCLAPTTGKVRFLPMPRVKEDLLKFLSANVKQVKFVDRTFNCDRQRAMEIWEFLIKNDNNITNFHFEIDANLLDFGQLDFLSKVRKGLFQFEIGIQSTNKKTLEESGRNPCPNHALNFAKSLRDANNIHLHLDLIVGLPYETKKTFRKSFNDVMYCYPHKLQVGFLKMIKGCKFERFDHDGYGFVFRDKAPYEIIETNDMSFENINQIKKIETMVDMFYNGKGFECSIKYLMYAFHTPYDFFYFLAMYWYKNKYHLVSHKKFSLYTILYEFLFEFCKENGFITERPREICELLKFDMLRQDNIRTYPSWIESYYSYDSKQVTRTTAIHSFDYDVYSWLQVMPLSRGWGSIRVSSLKQQEIKILFDYSKQGDERCHVLCN